MLYGPKSLVWLVACAFLLEACGAAPGSSPQPPSASAGVELRNGPYPGSVEIVAQGSVKLDAELIVEQQLSDGSFQPVRNLDLDAMKLVASCGQAVNACVSVDEHGLQPVAWSGMSCSSQCNHSCDKNERLSGRHRFVVKSCDGKTRFVGPVFEMPKVND